MSGDMKRIMEAIGSRVKLLVGRGRLSGVNDGGKRQRVQFTALAGETKDSVERFQQFGFTSHPMTGADVIFVAIGGSRDHPIALAVDDPRYRHLDLEAGEVALYNAYGDTVILKKDRVVEVNTMTVLVKASEKVRFETPQLECTGEIIDRVETAGLSMSDMRETYNSHVHDENDGGGPTEAPSTQMVGG